MAVGGIYILIQAKEKEIESFNLSYIISRSFRVGFINNKLVKDPIVLSEEVKLLRKHYIYISCWDHTF